MSGLRFALYTTNDGPKQVASIRTALRHIYTSLWVDCVVRSPLFKSDGKMDISSTNFEPRLDSFLGTQSWFR